MFVRCKKNRSGSIYIQVIDKSLNKYKVIHSLGSSSGMSAVEMMENPRLHAVGLTNQLPTGEFPLRGDRLFSDQTVSYL